MIKVNNAEGLLENAHIFGLCYFQFKAWQLFVVVKDDVSQKERRKTLVVKQRKKLFRKAFVTTCEMTEEREKRKSFVSFGIGSHQKKNVKKQSA